MSGSTLEPKSVEVAASVLVIFLLFKGSACIEVVFASSQFLDDAVVVSDGIMFADVMGFCNDVLACVNNLLLLVDVDSSGAEWEGTVLGCLLSHEG
jgi:hypothetical protein